MDATGPTLMGEKDHVACYLHTRLVCLVSDLVDDPFRISNSKLDAIHSDYENDVCIVN